MFALRKIRRILFGSNLNRDILEMKFIHKGLKFPLYLKIWCGVLDFFNEQFTNFIIIPFEILQRMCYWGWKLRYNYDFDCNNTYYILYLKFKGLIDYSRTYAHLCWNSKENGKEFRKLKIACELAKRLYEDDYDTHMNRHDKKWNISNNDFLFESNMLIQKSNQGLKEQHLKRKRKEYKIAWETDEKQKSNERKYLYQLLEKHLEGWWD